MSNPRTAPLVLAQGDPAPQYWEDEAGQYEVTRGKYGAYLARNVGMTCVASQSRTGNYIFDLTDPANGFSIINDGSTDVSFTIGAVNIVVKPGEAWSSLFKPFTTAQVVGVGAWRGAVYE